MSERFPNQEESFNHYKRVAYDARKNKDENKFRQAVEDMFRTAKTEDELKRTLIYTPLGTERHHLIEEKLSELISESDSLEIEAA